MIRPTKNQLSPYDRFFSLVARMLQKDAVARTVLEIILGYANLIPG